MSDWKKDRSFLDHSFEEHEVAPGKTEKFYILPAITAFKLKTYAKPFASAIASMYDNKDLDARQSEELVQFDAVEGGDGAGTQKRLIVEAAEIDVIKMRHDQRVKAVEDLLDLFLDNEEMIAVIVMSSMRDWFPHKADHPPASEFLEQVPTDVFIEMLKGVAKANRKVLGPFSDTLSKIFKKRQTADENKPDATQGQEPTNTNGDDSNPDGPEAEESPSPDLKLAE